VKIEQQRGGGHAQHPFRPARPADQPAAGDDRERSHAEGGNHCRPDHVADRPKAQQALAVVVSTNANGTRNAGSVYFHVCIIVAITLPPVMADAATDASARRRRHLRQHR
jgi:hypothetical protein